MSNLIQRARSAIRALSGPLGRKGSSLVSDALDEWKAGTKSPRPDQPPPKRVEAPAPAKRLSVAEKEAAARQAFIDGRRPLQESVLDADGDVVSHRFDESGIGQIEVPHRDARYTIPISKNNGVQVWIYNTDGSLRSLSRVGAAEHHELIDVTQLRPVARDLSIGIGECVVAEAEDGSIIQLLLVDAHARINGDEVDDARFKYKVYEKGTSQIRALRNGS